MTSISSVGSSNNWSQTSMVQGRRPPGGDAPDPATMFKKIDTDGSGGISQSELQTMFTDMASKMGDSSNTPDAAKMIKQFDADSDGSLSQTEMDTAMQSMAPPPPPSNTMDFIKQRGSSDSSSAQDTMTQLLSAIDTDSDGDISKSELSTFKSLLSQETQSTGSATSSTSSSSTSNTSGDLSSKMEELARKMIERYASLAASTASQTSVTTSSLSVAA